MSTRHDKFQRIPAEALRSRSSAKKGRIQSFVSACLLVGAAAGPACGQPAHLYTLVAVNRTTAIFVDFPSVKKVDGHLQSWSLWVFYPIVKHGNVSVSYQLIRDLNDCSAATRAITDVAAYTEDGSVAETAQALPRFDTIVPSSIGEQVQIATCTGRSPIAHASSFDDPREAANISRQVLKESLGTK